MPRPPTRYLSISQVADNDCYVLLFQSSVDSVAKAMMLIAQPTCNIQCIIHPLFALQWPLIYTSDAIAISQLRK